MFQCGGLGEARSNRTGCKRFWQKPIWKQLGRNQANQQHGLAATETKKPWIPRRRHARNGSGRAEPDGARLEHGEKGATPSPFSSRNLLFKKGGQTLKNGWFLKRTMAEANGESKRGRVGGTLLAVSTTHQKNQAI